MSPSLLPSDQPNLSGSAPHPCPSSLHQSSSSQIQSTWTEIRVSNTVNMMGHHPPCCCTQAHTQTQPGVVGHEDQHQAVGQPHLTNHQTNEMVILGYVRDIMPIANGQYSPAQTAAQSAPCVPWRTCWSAVPWPGHQRYKCTGLLQDRVKEVASVPGCWICCVPGWWWGCPGPAAQWSAVTRWSVPPRGAGHHWCLQGWGPQWSRRLS